MSEGTSAICSNAVSAKNMAVIRASGALIVLARARAIERKRNSRAGMNGARAISRSMMSRLIHSVKPDSGMAAHHCRPSNTMLPALRTP